ncbi:ATP-binding protein [Dactylosporangium sp. CA-233914]|uniref:ATP-binding protein n=1 Tax=Dactylosporangium sp. CA-233914 TaxID=3239934 RepID=UPI003D8D9C20
MEQSIPTGRGADARLIRVRATVDPGAGSVTITGLPANSVHLTRDRLYAATVNAGLSWPTQSVRLEVLPAGLLSGDSGVDLALAVALLAVTGQAPAEVLRESVVVGELGLDGSVRTPRAMSQRLAAVAAAGCRLAWVPAGSRELAVAEPAVAARLVHHLRELVTALHAAAPGSCSGWPSPGVPIGELADVSADQRQVRLLEVAAAGGHHLAMIGPAGMGADVLARCLPSLLPDLGVDAGREVAELYRMAGLIPDHVEALRRPPWQAPHATATIPALIGSPRRPGAVSLAHHGLLFLDDAARLGTRTLEALRQPLDTRQIALTGMSRTVTYPAAAQLILAARHCPCNKPGFCACTPARRRRYLSRLRPLLARVEIRASLPPTPYEPATTAWRPEPSTIVAARVAAARAAAAARWAERSAATAPAVTNHTVPDDVVRRSIAWLAPASRTMLHAALETGTVSVRGATRVVRLAWTMADLAGHDHPDRSDIAEAVALAMPEHA